MKPNAKMKNIDLYHITLFLSTQISCLAHYKEFQNTIYVLNNLFWAISSDRQIIIIYAMWAVQVPPLDKVDWNFCASFAKLKINMPGEKSLSEFF